MKFNKLLELRANALITAGFHVVILGDINISHKPIDHCDPYDVSNAYQLYDALHITMPLICVIFICYDILLSEI